MAHTRKGFEITPIIRQLINAMAKKTGCHLNWHRAPGIQWNGKDVACKDQDASNIIHDIAHYVLATKKARKYFDYGLDAGPDTNYEEFRSNKALARTIYSDAKCAAIEKKASALGIYWEKMLGLPWEDTMKYHAWNSQSELKDEWGKLSEHIKKVGTIK